jgi:hypothetical protein
MVKSPNFLLDQIIPPGVSEIERTPFSKTQCLLRLISSGVSKLISFLAMQILEKLKQAVKMKRFLMDRGFIKLLKG